MIFLYLRKGWSLLKQAVVRRFCGDSCSNTNIDDWFLLDIEISTIHDVYEDELNAAAKIPSSQEGKQKKFGPKKIIFSGVGQLSFKDTELARLGQATLLCYNVGIDKLALQNLKVSQTFDFKLSFHHLFVCLF